MAQWLRDNRVPVAWIYVHENPASKLGDAIPNSHLLVHVPAKHKLAFKTKLPDWFDANADGAVKVDPRMKANYFGPDKRLSYMAKGADDFTCWRYGGRRKPGGQGEVLCKRSGCSQNISWKARGIFTLTKSCRP